MQSKFHQHTQKQIEHKSTHFVWRHLVHLSVRYIGMKFGEYEQNVDHHGVNGVGMKELDPWIAAEH